MTLITKAQTQQLLTNGQAQRAAIDRRDQALDFKPVVKLFTPDAQCTWLLTELDADHDVAFGLCDLHPYLRVAWDRYVKAEALR